MAFVTSAVASTSKQRLNVASKNSRKKANDVIINVNQVSKNVSTTKKSLITLFVSDKPKKSLIKFQCDLCKLIFVEKSLLQKHLEAEDCFRKRYRYCFSTVGI